MPRPARECYCLHFATSCDVRVCINWYHAQLFGYAFDSESIMTSPGVDDRSHLKQSQDVRGSCSDVASWVWSRGVRVSWAWSLFCCSDGGSWASSRGVRGNIGLILYTFDICISYIHCILSADPRSSTSANRVSRNNDRIIDKCHRSCRRAQLDIWRTHRSYAGANFS